MAGAGAAPVDGMDFGGWFAGEAGTAITQVHLGPSGEGSLKDEVKKQRRRKTRKKNEEDERFKKSGGAAERGDGLLRQHGHCARAAWSGEHRAASCGLRSENTTARAAGLRGNRGPLRRTRAAGSAAGPFSRDWRVRADGRENCGPGE